MKNPRSEELEVPSSSNLLVVVYDPCCCYHLDQGPSARDLWKEVIGRKSEQWGCASGSLPAVVLGLPKAPGIITPGGIITLWRERQVEYVF